MLFFYKEKKVKKKFFFEREREKARAPKQGSRQREREHLKQAPRWSWSLMWGSISQPWDYDLSWTIQWRNGQKTWIDTSPKKTSRWLTHTWKTAQHHSSSGKYTSKPHWDTTTHLSEWLKLTTQETTDVSADAEKKEHICTVRNANWCSHSEKQYGGSSRN